MAEITGTSGPITKIDVLGGVPGAAGVSVTTAELDADGHLLIGKSNGVTLDVGKVKFDVTPEVQAAWDGAVAAETEATTQAGIATGAATRAEAVGDTNDAIMAYVTSDDNSEFRGELDSIITAQVSPVASDVADLETLTTTGRLSVAELNTTIARSRWVFPIDAYGAKRAKFITDASMTANSDRLSSTSHQFGTDDIGKHVGVRGAGYFSTNFNTVANDGVLIATIIGVSGGDALLDVQAVTTGANMPCVFGFPIDDAVNAAVADATSMSGGSVYFPAGIWVAAGTVPFRSKISFMGAGRSDSLIYVAKTGAAEVQTTSPWLRSAGNGPSNYYNEVNMSDFTVDGRFYVATNAYAASLKMISVSHTSNSTVERIGVLNNPATAIGYDESINCLIASNLIDNFGRLAPVSKFAESPGGGGGSGIGLAVGHEETSMVIRDNFIYGRWNVDGATTGRAGVLIEAGSATTASEGKFLGGIKVIGNHIEACFNGVVDCGAAGSIISHNTFRRNQNGVRIGSNGISNGFIGRDTIVSDNIIEDGTSVSGFGTGASVIVTSRGASYQSEGRTQIHDNIMRGGKGYGLWLRATDQELIHVNVRGNAIRDHNNIGLRVSGTFRDLAIVGNSLSSNRRAASAGAAMAVDYGVVWTDGRIESNDSTDYQTTPTQTSTLSVGSTAVLTNVARSGNTGDPV